MAVEEVSVPPALVPSFPARAFERKRAGSRGRSRTTSAKLERKRGGAWGEWWVRTNEKSTPESGMLCLLCDSWKIKKMVDEWKNHLLFTWQTAMMVVKKRPDLA